MRAVRLSDEKREKLATLAQVFELSESDVQRVAIDYLWDRMLDLATRARDLVARLITDEAGGDTNALLVLAVGEAPSVTVAIAGHPAPTLQAVTWPDPQPGLPVIVWEPGTPDVIFDLGRHEPGDTIEMPLIDLVNRQRLAIPPRTKGSEDTNADIRRQWREAREVESD
jgi:hypothetical protein